MFRPWPEKNSAATNVDHRHATGWQVAKPGGPAGKFWHFNRSKKTIHVMVFPAGHSVFGKNGFAVWREAATTSDE